MKGSLEPKIVIVDHDGVVVVRRPFPSQKCGPICKVGEESPCDWCCYQEALNLLLSIYRPELPTLAEAQEAQHHEWN